MSAPTRSSEQTRAQPRSFRSFYDEHVDRVTALAVAMTTDRASAQDVVQEAFTRALRDWEHVRTYDNPGGWIRTVAANLSRSTWRKLKSEARALSRLGPRPDGYELREPAGELWSAVARLPRRQATAIALHYVDDMAVDDIAAVLGVPAGTVKSDLHRGRERLTQLLVKEGIR